MLAWPLVAGTPAHTIVEIDRIIRACQTQGAGTRSKTCRRNSRTSASERFS
jgi:hypothetical protein